MMSFLSYKAEDVFVVDKNVSFGNMLSKIDNWEDRL